MHIIFQNNSLLLATKKPRDGRAYCNSAPPVNVGIVSTNFAGPVYATFYKFTGLCYKRQRHKIIQQRAITRNIEFLRTIGGDCTDKRLHQTGPIPNNQQQWSLPVFIHERNMQSANQGIQKGEVAGLKGITCYVDGGSSRA